MRRDGAADTLTSSNFKMFLMLPAFRHDPLKADLPDQLAGHERLASTSFVFPRSDTQQPRIVNLGGSRSGIVYNSPNQSSELAHHLAILRVLAAALSPRLETVRLPEGDVVGLVYSRPDSEMSLYSRIVKGEALRDTDLRAVARLIAEFHFHDVACPVAQTNLGELLRQKIVVETRRALFDYLSAEGLETDTARWWFDRINGHLLFHRDRITEAATALREPIVGYCDLELKNIVALPKDKIAIVDLDLIPGNFVRTRRMDAGVLRAELEVCGRPQEAGVYWRAYDRAYCERLKQRGEYYELGSDVAIGVAAIDTCALFQRYVMAYKAAFIAKDTVSRLHVEGLINTLLNGLDK